MRITGALWTLAAGCVGFTLSSACVSIDPGAQYVIPAADFNENYFYCYVEPNLIFGKKCGDDGSGGCHYSDKVPAMQLTAHPQIDCGGGGTPLDSTQVGMGSPAADNYSAVSIQMSTDWQNAPIYIWPTQIVSAHPKKVFDPTDPVVKYISTWATE